MMYRSFVLLGLATCSALASLPRTSGAQDRGTIRLRVTTRDSSGRARQEQLLLRLDSLRFQFDTERLSDADRERLANEMHRTLMALQSSMDELSASAMAAARAGTATMERMRTPSPALAFSYTMSDEPRGYLGVSFDGPYVERSRNGERSIRFLDYPRIALVEPSSPAERAGIRQGDTLVAFNGDDVRNREIRLAKLLVPDQRVLVRVRRDGSPRDFRVTIDEAPPSYVMRRMSTMPPTPATPMAMPAVPEMPAPVRVYVGGTPRPPAPRVFAAPSMPVAVAPSVWMASEGIGGAHVETITEGLGRALGTRSGVLVIRAGPGTPAFESGLRDGDVILRANGLEVSSVRELRAVLMRGGGDEEGDARLVVLRDRKKRELTLRQP